MKFKFTNGIYTAQLKYKRSYDKIEYEITAIFDTGCSMTSISLFSLSNLLGVNYENLVCDLENQVYNMGYSINADNQMKATPRIILPNLVLHSEVLNSTNVLNVKRLYCKVNMDYEVAESNGIIRAKMNGQEITKSLAPYILIGNDFIKHFESFYGTSESIVTSGFNEEKYLAEQSSKEPEPLFLFSSQDYE